MTNLIWYDGEWCAGDKHILGPLDHAFWMATVAFDGARSFENVAPDLGAHCNRLVQSARNMLLEPTHTAAEIEALCLEGLRRLPQGHETYIRPAFFARRGFVVPVAASTDFTLAIIEMPMPEPKGMAVCFSNYRRPAQDMAPTDAKAGCLYPNLQRALVEANRLGFDNAITSDPNGNIAELATANIWMVKNGEVFTPAANGTFLAGVTRQRVAELLHDDGIIVHEACLSRPDFESADELFSTGNYGKVMPIVRLQESALPIGPVFRRARELYWKFAHTTQAIL
ncbi:MAG: branched-chain amino acid aminotransferase [Pseudomonadota bacterium]